MLAHIAGLGPGDEAITSPISFASSANCFIFGGATPVFADVDARTLNLDPAAVEAAITPRTKAIVAVDMFGYPCELDELRAICDRHGLALIEDAAEALGAEYKGRPIGSHGPSGVFGFYPNKQLATGEGGVVFTHSEREWQLVRSLRNQGRDYEGGGWFHHVRVGWNYRWTDVQAAIGIGQLEKLDRLLALRSQVAARYDALLDGSGVEPLCADDADHRRSWFVYVVKVPEGVDRDRVMAELRSEGIGTADYVPCVHLQPYMRETYGFREGTLPGRGSRGRAHARAAVLPAPRTGRSGARSRRAPSRALANGPRRSGGQTGAEESPSRDRHARRSAVTSPTRAAGSNPHPLIGWGCRASAGSTFLPATGSERR